MSLPEAWLLRKCINDELYETHGAGHHAAIWIQDGVVWLWACYLGRRLFPLGRSVVQVYEVMPEVARRVYRYKIGVRRCRQPIET